MLLLKANSELQKTFEKLIKTMKAPVAWNDVFVISNNSLILAGDVRSLIFNFDNKRLIQASLKCPKKAYAYKVCPQIIS